MVKTNCTNERKDTNADINKRLNVIQNIYNAVNAIQYGSVQIHIQDGEIVQIDKIEKTRVR